MPVKNIIPGQHVTKEKLQRAKELRRDMVPAEKLLWQEVRAKKLGVRFRPPPPLSGHLPQIRQGKIFMRIQISYRRIWGRLSGGRNDEVVKNVSAVVGKIKELVSKQVS